MIRVVTEHVCPLAGRQDRSPLHSIAGCCSLWCMLITRDCLGVPAVLRRAPRNDRAADLVFLILRGRV